MRGRELVITGLLLVLGTCSLGCSGVQPKKDELPKVYNVATRPYPPQPVYNRLRWVRPPSMKPDRDIEGNETPLILPIMQFEVKDEPLKEVVHVFAAMAQYRAYCSSAVGDRVVSIRMIGTMDEIANKIESEAGVEVVIDHENQEVRFLVGNHVAPRFAS